MKYFKILAFVIFLNVSSNASMLLPAVGYCIEDFYIKNGSIYYLRSDNDTWYTNTSKTYVTTIQPNYIYDISTQQCKPNAAYILGMQVTEYNFLLGLVGLIFGAVFLFFTTQIFINLGGKR